MKSERTVPVFRLNITSEPLSIAPPPTINPLVKSSSMEGTIGASINPPVYSVEQHHTWNNLFEKHHHLLQSEQYLCQEYKEGLKKLNLPKDRIPELKTTSETLKKLTGWEIIRVDGYVEPKFFFKLLAHRLFPCTDFIRSNEESDFTALPDTFHEQIGHLPMIAHQRFADFFQFFGFVSTRISTAEHFEWLNRIYWFTAEAGLINPTFKNGTSDPSCTRIYGASIASSCGEILYSLSDNVKRYKFDLDHIMHTPFDIAEKQSCLFEISSFDELENSFQAWAIKNKFVS